MKPLIATLFTFGALAFFASESQAQCYASPGIYRGGGVYRSTTTFYGSPNIYRGGVYNYSYRGPVYGTGYRGYPVNRFPHHHHVHGYRGPVYGGGRGGVYYGNPGFGLHIRF